VAIYLQDMTPETGPLLVVPGSHRWRREPSAEEEQAEIEGEIPVAVDAGTAVVFNAQLWHSGGRNESDRPRRAVFPYFGHYWIKRMDEFYRRPLPDYVLEHDDPLVRQLFGLGLATASVHGGYDDESYG
jgi:ectoine hydroxylase-related dioxygenase (phytanoyl-CoA dioxygenase family)